MKFTGEKFIPSDELSVKEIGIEHLHRYHSILHFIKDKSVLDVASGEGYGSSLMAKTAKLVYGIDIDPEAIAHASAKYPPKKEGTLNFLEGSVEQIPLPDHFFDVVISFETIEHVDGVAQQKFMDEVKRVLKDDGLLIISTPDKKNYSERYGHKNEYHVKEFDREEFREFMEKNFTHTRYFDQGYEIVSAITETDPEEVWQVSVCDWDRPLHPFARKYLLAVASKRPLPRQLPLSSVVFQVDRDYQATMDRIVEKETRITQLGEWGKNLDQEILQNRSKIKEDATIIDELTETIKKLEILTASFNKEIIQKDLEISRLGNEVTDKDQMILEKNKKISDLYLQKDILTDNIAEIYASEGWKLLSKYYWLRNKILPPESKRQRVVKNFVNRLRGKNKSAMHLFIHPKTGGIPQKTPANPLPPEEPKNYAPLTFPIFTSPKVSIIVPVFNGWDINCKCLRSIYEHTQGVAYEVIIADDVSTDETRNISEYIKNIVHVRNDQNLGFLKNCNHAATFAKGSYIHFLNNDTEVAPGWLSSLVVLMEKDSTIGMTGSKLVYPDGRLQEAGGILWQDGSGWNYGNRQDPEASEFNYLKEVDYISGASILIRKSLWEKLGGFDERFSPAYCEDSDLAFAVRKLGFKVVYQPQSVVTHFEGFSHGTDHNNHKGLTDIKSFQEINSVKLFEKWRPEFQKQLPNGVNPFWSRDRSRNKKTILFIDHYIPQFDKDAGSKTTFQYLDLFVSLGFNIKFLSDNFYRHEPYCSSLQQLGIEVLYGPWYRDHWQQWILDNREKFNYVYLNRPHIAIKYIDFIKENTPAKILYYGHDLHYIRELKQYEIEKDPLVLASAIRWKETETYLFSKADVILTPSEAERTVIAALDLNANIKTIRPFFYAHSKNAITDFSNRKDLLFVGGFNHKPNIDAVLWFVNEIWPSIKSQIPGVNFIIVGSNPPEEVMRLAAPDILVKGFVNEATLQETYALCRVTIIPLRYGAGVKGKTVEAMYQGVPIITTGDGIEGMPGDISFLHPTDSAADFANQVITIYNDEQALSALSRLEIDYINACFSKTVAKKIILQALGNDES